MHPLLTKKLTNTTLRYAVKYYCANWYSKMAIIRKYGKINDWDVSKVTNMNDMFSGATSFNEPLNNWNVSNVTDMDRVFEDATSFNQPLNKWNVSKVRNMSYMFYNAESFNQPLNKWNVQCYGYGGYVLERRILQPSAAVRRVRAGWSGGPPSRRGSFVAPPPTTL